MRARFTYLRWRLRGRGLVRLHMPGQPSIEGLLVGCRGGHYLLLSPKLLSEDGSTHELAGTVEVPRERVLLVQNLV